MEEVVIVGASIPGLALAALLNLLSIPNIILDARDCKANFWSLWTYERLKFDIAQFFCANPGVPHSSTLLQGKDIRRHKDEFNRILRLNLKFGQIVDGMAYFEEIEKYKLLVINTAAGRVEEREAKFVIMAKSFINIKMILPDYRGLENFMGEIIHNCDYKGGLRYAGKRVLVMGIGEMGNVPKVADNLEIFGAHPTIYFPNLFFKVIEEVDNKLITFTEGWSGEFDIVILVTETIENVWRQVGYHPQQSRWYSQIVQPIWRETREGLYNVGVNMGLAGALVDALNIADEINMFYRSP